MSNVTIKQDTAVKMIAAGIDLDEAFPTGWVIEGAETVAAKKAPAKKADGRNHEARKHNYEARMARRTATKLGGLTKQERSALYAQHPELGDMSATKRAAEWKRIVAAYKAAN